jgi:CBS-domain-containing membrane protein
MKALDLMKTHVVKTTADATLAQAVDLMDLYFVTGLPVIDADARYCGLLLDSDVLQAVSEADGFSADPVLIEPADRISGAAARRVRDVMRRNAVAISEHDDVRMVLPLFLSGEIDRLSVIDDLGHVVGMVYRVDLLQALFEGEFV